ncbi:30S ribosomal protein S21 [Patescibacteria group bacterium]|nr:30S ribosomal protein S21 [Patescibacteria group bacterium]
MPLEARKKKRETSISLIRRFSRRVKKSGILRQARKVRFKKREKSEQAKKRAALRKEELKKEYKRLKKLGKLKK